MLATCLCSYNIFSCFLALSLMLLCNDANGLLRVSVVQHSDNCSIINILFSMCYFVSSLRIYNVATFVCRGNPNITQLKTLLQILNNISCSPVELSMIIIVPIIERKMIILQWMSLERKPWFPLAKGRWSYVIILPTTYNITTLKTTSVADYC